MNDTDLVELAPNEWDVIGKIVADGFADDPINLWALNGTGAMRPMYTAVARHLYLPRGFGHRSTDNSAGTLWLPPGVDKHIGLLPTLTIAGAVLAHGGPRAVRRALGLDNRMKVRRPKTPHFYLFAIAVHPSKQGKGLGGRLLREGLRRADEAGMPAYLENSNEKNLGFYRAHGFRVVEELQPGKGCTPMWLMWREAGSSQAP